MVGVQLGEMRFQLKGKMGKISVHAFSNLFLLTEGTVTMEVGSLFQYFTTLTEQADPFLQRWLAPWSTL